MKIKNAIFCTISLLMSILMYANKGEHKISKRYSFTYNNTSKKTILDIKNKFGNLVYKQSNDSTIRIEVDVEITDCSSERVHDFYDSFSIEERKKGNVYVLETIMGNRAKSRGKCNFSVRVDYLIYLPDSPQLKVNNQFGDVNLGNVKNKVDASIRYGDLIFGDLKGTKYSIQLSFGELTGKSIQNANIDIKYADLNVEKIQNTTIDSKFTNLYLDKVKANLEVKSQHGKIRLNKLEQGFQNIDIHASFTPISIGVYKEVSFQFDLKTSFGNISENLEGIQNIRAKKESFNNFLKGRVKDGKATLKVSNKHAKIKIRTL